MKVENLNKPSFKGFARILPLNDCQSILETLTNKSNNFNAVEVGSHVFTSVDIRNMVTIHQLEKMKKHAAETEVWLNTAHEVPTPSCTAPEIKWIQKFKQWVWPHQDTKVLLNPSTTTSDLVTLCGNAWIELQTIQAFLPCINNVSNGRRALLLSSLIALNDNDLEKTLSEELRNVSNIIFILHVGLDGRHHTQISSTSLPGNHWALLTLDLSSGTFQYLDSLCWAVPANLGRQLKRILEAINKFNQTAIQIPDNVPSAHSVSCSGIKKCKNGCLVNYPIQTCGSVCGPISVLIAAIFVNSSKYWQDVVQSHVYRPSCWLRDPTKNSSYIRKVLISWLMQQRVNVCNLGIPEEVDVSLQKPQRLETGEKRCKDSIDRTEKKSQPLYEHKNKRKSDVITIPDTSSDEEPAMNAISLLEDYVGAKNENEVTSY